jgi:anaerobic magnesium-protoporphyrin IX monomethyl ester cyclase
MTSVLVANSYFYPLDPKQWKFKQPYPPLGSLWAASAIRQQGFEVSFFDTNLLEDPIEIVTALSNLKPGYFVIYDDGFNYLTKMCLTVMREAVFSMANEAKRAACTVIISSSDASDHYENYFLHGVDYVIRGEGELTVCELLSALEQKQDPSIVNGVVFRKDLKTIETSPRPVIRNPDSLPLPAWDLIDIKPYQKIWKAHHGYFSLNLATTRGCPYKCNWCAKPIYGNRYNSRSPQQVVSEIEMLLIRYQPDHFWMSDDIFGLKPGWVREFARLIEQKNLNFKYKIQSRVDLLLEEETLQALAVSGVDTIWVGAESGSQKILDAMDKGIRVEQIEEATRLMKRNRIHPAFFLQFGYPGETWDDIQSTLKMVLALMPDEIGISVSYPLPGTKFYDSVKADLQAKQNWADSDDLAMMFRGTYRPAFYKVLHRYVHNRYRIQRGLNQMKEWWANPSQKEFPQLRKIASMVYNFPLSLINASYLRRLGKIDQTA